MKTQMVVVLVVLLFVCPAWGQEARKEAKSSPKVVPIFSLDRPVSEAPMGDDPLFGASGVESFHDLVTRLKKARDDQDVPAIVILADSVGLGRAQVEEVRRVMDEIKKSGKKIYTHADDLSMGEYVLLSGCSHLSVTPQADVFLTGMHAESLHVRGLLDRLGVEPDFLTCGKYKSAGELYTRYEPSPEADENLNWLIDGIHETNLRLISEGRGRSLDEIRKWIDKGIYTGGEACELGIVDAVEYREDFVARLKREYGENVKLEKRYGKDKGLEIDLSSPFGVMKFYADLLSGGAKKKSTKDAVAIVYVEGPIMVGQADPNSFPFGGVGGIAYSTPIRKALDRAADDDTIKAVVLRVDSPGGSAVGSEVILEATKRLKAKKPLVVSMGNVAGSGGYYVACGTDTIFAESSTITASIGVVLGKLGTQSFWNSWGITWHEYDRGKNAGILHSAKTFTGEQRDLLQNWMDEIYDVFKGHVTQVRGDRLKKDLDDMAGGRVYTGKQALELGLVDKLGGLSEAIAFAAGKANVKDYDVRVLPEPKNFAEMLTESLTGEEPDNGPVLESTPPRESGVKMSSGAVAEALSAVRAIDPARANSLTEAVRMLDILRTEGVLLNTPIIHFTDDR